MKVGEQVTNMEVCSDQATGSNEHKSEVVEPKRCVESSMGSKH